MTVFPLPLSGLTDAQADKAVHAMLDHRTGPLRLERVLVLDDTAALVGHEPLFQRIVASNRVHALLCVAVGPRAGDGKLWLPQSLGGTQGYGVIWVGDPAGIDWRIALVPIANGHEGGANGLDQLVDLLSVDEVFDRVHKAYEGREVHGKLASPGLRLAGADDESAAFTAALGVAMGRLCAAGAGPDGPFAALSATAAGGAVLAENGPIARYRDEVDAAATEASRALAGLTGTRGLLRRGDGGVHGHLVELRAALTDLRDLVTRLLLESNTTGQLTDNQRQLLLASGIGFETGTQPTVSGPVPAGGAQRSAVLRAIAAAVRGGDTLPLVARRLAKTGREVKRRGSASYLPEVEKACPVALIEHLAAPAPRSARRGMDIAEARQALGIDAARRAAHALTELIVQVANREWSPSVTSSADLDRARIALDGIRAALAERTEPADDATGTRGARLAKLADYLLPVLSDLVVRAVADEAAAPGAGGQETFQAGYDRAATLHEEWVQRVQADGLTAMPKFASSSHGAIPPDIEDDVVAIKEALLYPPTDEMWQLCAPGDLAVLDVTAQPQVIRFASRLSKDSLAGTLPTGEIEWTTSGGYAGLLRLVPLRSGIASASWVAAPPPPAPGQP
jgi:hypothetical protein